MRRALTAAVLGGLMVAASTTPAWADDTEPDTTPPVISSTGLTEGQLVPGFVYFWPTITDDRQVEGATSARRPLGRSMSISPRLV